MEIGRDRPCAPVEVDLVPAGHPRLGRSHRGHGLELDSEPGCRISGRPAYLVEGAADFGVRECTLMLVGAVVFR